MLKLDLLPAHYAIARRNRQVLFMSIPLVAATLLVWLMILMVTNKTITRTNEQLEETRTQADVVRKLEAETTKRQGELAPIQAKLTFVQQADQSGGQFWDRFHQLNRYIYDRAVVSSFSITPPSSVSFTADVETTEEAARFILNMVRCPYITSFSISAPTSMEGGQIRASLGAPGATGAAGAPAAAGAGAPGGPEMPGAAPGGPEMGPGGGPPGAPAAGAPIGVPGGSGPIRFTVTCTLKQSIAVPTPPAAGGGGAAPGGPGGMPGGPPGAPGGGEGGPPGGGDGAPPPGPSSGDEA